MFKFKNLGNKTQKALQPVRDVNEVIAEIHNEFDTSTERLLNEAKSIIAKIDNSKIGKAERLKQLGFHSSAPVKQTAEQVLMAEEIKKNSELILHYQQWYPNNKFITEKEVERICKKYGLVCGVVYNYTGDVPLTNLTEIENFKLRDEEKTKRTNIDDYVSMPPARSMSSALANVNPFGLFGQTSLLARPQYHYTDYSKVPETITEYFIQPPFKICAPVKDFDMNRMTIEDGYKVSHIPDPIVLQPVKGGYLIVSKWGLEASDEIVVNEKMN